MSDKPFNPLPAAYYGSIYNIIQTIGHENGYAITIHGSLQRDFDLVAIPWIDEAIEPFELVKSIAEVLKGVIRNSKGYLLDAGPEEMIGKPYFEKPHGRMAYKIYLGDSFGYKVKQEIRYYIDLSIMPKIQSPINVNNPI